MGFSPLSVVEQHIMIKSIILVCLVGAAYAEADADAYYGYGGYPFAYVGYRGYAGYAGYPYAHAAYGYAGVPFGSSTGLDPITQGVAIPAHTIAKRSADADADAYYGYGGYPFAYGGYAGYGGYARGYAGYAGYPYA